MLDIKISDKNMPRNPHTIHTGMKNSEIPMTGIKLGIMPENTKCTDG